MKKLELEQEKMRWDMRKILNKLRTASPPPPQGIFRLRPGQYELKDVVNEGLD